MAEIVRGLAPSEGLFARGGVFIGYSARVSGRLDPALLTSAFAAVVRAYPILGTRIELGDGGYSFVVADGPPEVFVVEGDPESPLTGARFDQRIAVSALCVVRQGDSASVTVMLHHSVADTFHAMEIVRALWAAYGSLVEGRPVLASVHPYPGPVEELLAARGISKIAPPGTAEKPVAAPEFTDNDDPYEIPVTSRCLLTVAETAALVEVGHRAEVTLHGLVSAAILLTEAEIRDLPISQLFYLYSVDLRTRLTPPIGPAEGTNVLGLATYLPTPEAGGDPIAIARGIAESLRTALAAGIVQQTPLHVADMSAAPPPAPGIVVATNWGAIPALAAPAGLRIDDFRSTIIAKPDRTGRRPQQPGAGTCIISTFADRLSVEIHHPAEFTDLQRRRVEILTTHLRKVIGR
ncbi:phthiocerol/phthiodiolone dimycocerosyl transferase family protein [Nocardia arthritidis]|uniref:Phthiocerol/phthiodiolone dimycocerosyl transferase n=1 Tax=Nocardia arthritidis TaxID=228602 RepID=A0A6G9YUI4_9NOCA|nr:acyltransferase [Nocardia arthritidis]QIS16761.1 acyltransferase [Nocardia arthritidis]